VGEGGASWWGYIAITVVVIIIISLTKQPLQHVFPHHHRGRIANAHFSPAKRRTAKTQILAQKIL